MCFLFIMFFFRWKIVIWRVFCGGYWRKSKGRKNEKIFLLEILRTLRATLDLLDPQHFGAKYQPKLVKEIICSQHQNLNCWEVMKMVGINIIKRRKIFWKFFICLKKNQQILKKCSWHLDPDPDSCFSWRMQNPDPNSHKNEMDNYQHCLLLEVVN